MKRLRLPFVVLLLIVVLTIAFALIRGMPDTASAPSGEDAQAHIIDSADLTSGMNPAEGPGSGSVGGSFSSQSEPPDSDSAKASNGQDGVQIGNVTANGETSPEDPDSTGAQAAGSGSAGGGAVYPNPANTEAAGSSVDVFAENFTSVIIKDYYLHKGSLVLINSDIGFEPPAYPDYVSLISFKSSSYSISESDMQISYSIIEPLNKMMDAFAEETGLGTIRIISAYRDNKKQQKALDEYIALVGPAEAVKWAALPGFSEHHTGLAFDLGVYSGGTVRTFTGTGKYAWFKENSYKYGFILRYPPDKTDVTKTASEPWHFRYVGGVHANLITEKGWCLEEYVSFIMQHPRWDSFFTLFDNDVYEIFYTRDTEFNMYNGCDYTVSGNNFDGYIVTIRWPLDVYSQAVSAKIINAVSSAGEGESVS